MSGDAKHTPGPWVVERRELSSLIWGKEANGYLAVVHQFSGAMNPKADEASANARLIAAAPELLSVVATCQAVFAKYAEMHRRKLTAEMTNAEREALHGKIDRNRDMSDLCLAIIAKAEGSL